MGSPISQVQMPQQQGQVQGKGQSTSSLQSPANMQQDMYAPAVMPQPSGKGGRITYPGQGGQPRMGQPNQYSNTVGPWDNASIGTQNPFQRSGKGKGSPQTQQYDQMRSDIANMQKVTNQITSNPFFAAFNQNRIDGGS